ncbi:hypothetical protein [Klebsiella oxytoca]|uniref:hypothetical protein n=1 Tax=Klebsiella oxytoca TaxID=571 RepID=UPI0039C96119
MKINITGYIIAAVILLSGCSSVGGEDKYSASYIESHLVKGKTTKAEVQQLYGVPDTNDKSSNGTIWVYRKGADYNSVSSLTRYIPGTEEISSVLGMASTASEVSSTASKLADKRSGNTEIHGDRLYIAFDESDIVEYWSIKKS